VGQRRGRSLRGYGDSSSRGATPPARERLVRQGRGTTADERVFNASCHVAWTRDSNVKMIVVWKRAVRLLHDLGSSNARSERRSNAFGVCEQPRSKWRGDENVGDVRGLVADHCRDQRPILGIVEVRARPANRSGVAAELNEVAREKLAPVGSVNEETDVSVTTALVRSVALDTTATLAGQMADGSDGLRELPADRPRGTIHHGY
jgi:hypothetical protein